MNCNTFAMNKIKIHPTNQKANKYKYTAGKDSNRIGVTHENGEAYVYEYHGDFIMQNGLYYSNPDYKGPKESDCSTQHNLGKVDGWEFHGSHDHFRDPNPQCFDGENIDEYQQQYYDNLWVNDSDCGVGDQQPGTIKTRANTAEYDDMPPLQSTDLHVNLSESRDNIVHKTKSKPPPQKKERKKAHEVNPRRLAAIEIALGLPESGKKTVSTSCLQPSTYPSTTPFSFRIIVAAMRRGFKRDKYVVLLIFTLIRCMLLILLFIYLMNYLANRSCPTEETCRGKLKALASFNCFVMIVHVLLGHRTLRLSTSFAREPLAVQQYIKGMCTQPPSIQFRVTCYRYLTVEEIELSKITMHTETMQFWHEGFTDNTHIPEGISSVVFSGVIPSSVHMVLPSPECLSVEENGDKVPDLDSSDEFPDGTIPCELLKIHGTIEYSFRDQLIESEFLQDQQRFINKHALCDRQRQVEIVVTGPNFETRKVCSRNSSNIRWFIRFRFLFNALLSVLSVNWFFVIFLEGITAHFDIVFVKEVVQ